jgi:hypothetical protein
MATLVFINIAILIFINFFALKSSGTPKKHLCFSFMIKKLHESDELVKVW